MPKGTILDRVGAHALIAAAETGDLHAALRLGWPGPDDLHEDDAAHRLALAVGGGGVDLRGPTLSRVELVAKWPGVLHVRVPAVVALAAIDPIEVFTLLHGQAVEAGEAVAGVKVAPHVVPAEVVRQGVRLARERGPLVEVRPYRTLAVPAIACEPLEGTARRRFEEGARTKLSALGSAFAGVTDAHDADPARATALVRHALDGLAGPAHPVILVGGVSAGDPLAPFCDALEALGGRFVRHGLPAHPGSMLWLAELRGSRLLGLPGCGMFSMATALDLVLPRLLTGEALDAASLAELAHGGLLTRDMRFRMPAYARGLEAPDT